MMEILEFRPPAIMRICAVPVGAASLVASCYQLWLALIHGEPARLPVVLMLQLPAALALTALRRRIRMDESGIIAQSLFSTRRIPYAGVRRVDEARAAVVIESTVGPITSTWLAFGERANLLRAVVERAKLTRSPNEPPFGIRARYVPRAQNISFTPHHARRPPPAETEDVVT